MASPPPCRTRYLLDYQVIESSRDVRVVNFRHARRRPLVG